MGRILWTDPALADLRDITDHVARDSAAYAARLGSRIVEAPRGLAQSPRSGSIVPEFDRDDLREILVYPYRLLYRIRDPDDECHVVAVIHGSRDLRRAFRPDDV